MRNFIKKIILFAIPTLLVWGSVEYFYQTVESNYSYKHRMITEQYDQIETLILGDSHAFFGINPAYLDSNAFSVSNIAQSLYFDQLLFEKHVDNIPNLKNVIITIGYYSLSQLANTKEDTWRKYFYHHQMKLKIPTITSFEIKKYSLATTRHFYKSVKLMYKYINKGTIIGCNPNGWGNYYTDSYATPLAKESLITARRHEDCLLDFEENLNRLSSIIAHCKKIRSNVYLIDMPVHPEYIKALNPNKFQKITTSCNELAVLNNHVTYINLREHITLKDTDFYDPDHLNHQGAKKYTKIINEIISNCNK